MNVGLSGTYSSLISFQVAIKRALLVRRHVVKLLLFGHVLFIGELDPELSASQLISSRLAVGAGEVSHLRSRGISERRDFEQRRALDERCSPFVACI